MTQRGQEAESRRQEVPGPEGTAQSLDKDLQKKEGKAKNPNKQNNNETIGATQETYSDTKDADEQVHGMGRDPKCCEILQQSPEEDSKVSREKGMRDEGPVSQPCGPPRWPTCLQINLSVRTEMTNLPLRLGRKNWSRDDQ